MIHNNNRNYFAKKLVYFKGGGGGQTVDYAYNARMASIGESQQAMAEDYFDFWEAEYKPMEQAQIASNKEMIPIETAYNKNELALKTKQNDAASKLLPGQTALTGAQNESALKLLPGATELAGAMNADSLTALKEKAPVRNAFYKASADGVDVEGRVNKAGADAAHSFAGSQDAMSRGAARMGVNPNSGRFASMTNTNALNRAKTISGARTKARTGAEQENYQRLTNAMGY